MIYSSNIIKKKKKKLTNQMNILILQVSDLTILVCAEKIFFYMDIGVPLIMFLILGYVNLNDSNKTHI